jgi:hypothetical protein
MVLDLALRRCLDGLWLRRLMWILLALTILRDTCLSRRQ